MAVDSSESKVVDMAKMKNTFEVEFREGFVDNLNRKST